VSRPPRLQPFHTTPNVTSIEKRGRGRWKPSWRLERGGDTEARQQKSDEGDATSDLLLKHLDATLATYV
jgi:hypothetical protein